MTLITVKNLALGYDSHVIAEGLNFFVNAGDYLCVVGENGSGKTTLIKTLLNLTRPLAGEIFRENGLKANEIGYLPQQTSLNRDFPASCKEIVLSGFQGRAGFRPFYTKEEKQKALDTMERLNIQNLASRPFKELSGGQQQRVLLARALCAAREILLLDEPVSGLDPRAAADMYALIESLNKSGVTVIMVSHDIQAAVRYASHILHIGNTVFFGSREEYLKSEQGRFFMGEEGLFYEEEAAEEEPLIVVQGMTEDFDEHQEGGMG